MFDWLFEPISPVLPSVAIWQFILVMAGIVGAVALLAYVRIKIDNCIDLVTGLFRPTTSQAARRAAGGRTRRR